jgi:hypothetical protein
MFWYMLAAYLLVGVFLIVSIIRIQESADEAKPQKSAMGSDIKTQYENAH